MRRFRVAAGFIAVAALGAGLFALPRLRVAAEPSTGFRDVPAAHWAAGAVSRLASVGIVHPDASGDFRPDEPISRGELSRWLLLARHITPPPPHQAPFPDVGPDYPFAGAAETAYRLALFNVDSRGNFGPDRPVSRQEAVLAALRVSGREWEARSRDMGRLIANLPFSDRQAIGEGYRPYVAAAVRASLVEGVPGSSFQPLAPLSRAEAAALVARILLPPESSAASTRGAKDRSGPAEFTLAPIRGREMRASSVLPMRATEYGAGEPWLSDTTFSGIRVRRGLVAVDPRVIPLGSVLYVEGYGYALAADTGSAIKGHRIDLYSEDAQEVAMFGIQPRQVWVLE
ncbi:MAG: S-layer homology domain-containing protein [Bacillota bacterium]